MARPKRLSEEEIKERRRQCTRRWQMSEAGQAHCKEYRKAYNARPDVKARNTAKAKAKWTDPEHRAKAKEQQRAWRKSLEERPEMKAKRLRSKAEVAKRFRQTPEFRAWMSEYRASEQGERRRLKGLEYQAFRYRTPEGKAAAAAVRHQRRAAGPPPKIEVLRRLYEVVDCHYCGVHMSTQVGRYDPIKVTVDHKIPLVRGGTNAEENLVACCLGCNTKKNKRTDSEFFAFIAQGGLGR